MARSKSDRRLNELMIATNSAGGFAIGSFIEEQQADSTEVNQKPREAA